MQTIKKSGNLYVLRLEPEEEFISVIQNFCKENGVHSAWLEAVGSTKDLELAYFNLDKKDYDTSVFVEFLEVVNITGNIALQDNKPFCHAHGIFSRPDMSTVGGHVVRCVVSATLEVSLRVLEGEMNRKFDEETNLHLLS